jgi:hypothetical protein
MKTRSKYSKFKKWKRGKFDRTDENYRPFLNVYSNLFYSNVQAFEHQPNIP